jgi:hypothetical protein
MKIKELENFINLKIDEFIKSLDNRFEKHVSNEFIKIYILNEFKSILTEKEYYVELVNAAYSSCVYLFESLLEHGCRVSCNGHHIAQQFASYFSDEKIELNNQDIIKQIKKSIIKYTDKNISFDLYDWFIYFINNIKINKWIDTLVEDTYEKLDLENLGILDVNNEYLLFAAGGDWQTPHKVKLIYNEDNTYDCQDQGEGFEKGLSEKQFCKKLGYGFDEHTDLITIDEWDKLEDLDFNDPLDKLIML